MPDLRVTPVQSMLHWEDAAANRAMFEAKLAPLAGTTDLIVLPEMFTTGFTMRSRELAEPMDGPTLDWMRRQAGTLGAALYGSVIITEGGSRYNRGLFVKPDGSVTKYDKRHLFRMADEQAYYAPGKERVIVAHAGRRILLQVCYDLRFPAFARARYTEGTADFDVMLYVACWPEARRYPWKHLLIARAIENQAYVVGVNRVGMDGGGQHYSGDSVVLDPKGVALFELPAGKEDMGTVVLDAAAQDDFRAKFPVGLDADDLRIVP